MNLKSNESRLTSLEEMMTHLERLVQELNQVILSQQRHIEHLEQQTVLLRTELDTALSETSQPRRLEDEKPPHY